MVLHSGALIPTFKRGVVLEQAINLNLKILKIAL